MYKYVQKLHKWKHMYRTGGQMETKKPLIRWRNLQGQKNIWVQHYKAVKAAKNVDLAQYKMLLRKRDDFYF